MAKDGAVSPGGNPGIKHPGSGGTHTASNKAGEMKSYDQTARHGASNHTGGAGDNGEQAEDRRGTATKAAKNAGEGRGFKGGRGGK